MKPEMRHETPSPGPSSGRGASGRNPRILVVGITPTMNWLVARCLARTGLRPVVLGFQPASPLALLPDCRRYRRLTGVSWNQGELDADLLEQIERACTEEKIDLVIPSDHDMALLLAQPRALRSARLCLLPTHESFSTLHDKWQFAHVLDALKLPYPRTVLAQTPEELLSSSLHFPIVTKPTAKWASIGVQVHQSRDELERTIAAKSLSAEFPVLVQEFVPGFDAGFSFLAREGSLLAYTMFVREPGRPRRFFEDDRLLSDCQTLLTQTRYSGVGHFDLRHDPARDEFRFLELNPRFWASLLSALAAGVNYPALLVDLDRLSPTRPERAQRLGEAGPGVYERGVSTVMAFSEKTMWRAYEHLYRRSGRRPW